MTTEPTTDRFSISATPEAALWVAEVRVSNFRNLANVRIPLERGVTFLVGENNTGKSSILLAIATACAFRRPMIEDLRRTGDKIESEATIDLVIRSTGPEFAEVVAQRLVGNYGRGPGEGEWAAIRVRLIPSRESSFLITRRSFLRWEDGQREWLDTGRVPSSQAMDLLAAHVVEASRDLAGDLLKRTSDWGQVLSDLGVTEADRRNLETRLKDLGGDLLQASPVLNALASQLLQMRDAQSSVDSVHLNPLPERLEDLTHSVDVAVRGNQDSAALPMRLQGSGSRSLAALRVYFALSELRIGTDKGVRPQLMTLLEEPEAHLHPQAQAAVYRSIRELQGQAVVTTHSPVLLGEAPPQAIRLLRFDSGTVKLHSLTDKTAQKVAVFRRYISRPLGELFFARLVILVDGAAERMTIPILLEPLFGRDIAGLGVALLDMQGQSAEWLQKVIDALYELGQTPWIAFADNDSTGLKAIEGCTDSDGRQLSATHQRVVMSGKKQLEQLLLDAGYYIEIEEIANEHAPWGASDPRAGQPRLAPYAPDQQSEYLDFLKKTKGWSGELIARAAMQNGRGIPEPIVELNKHIRQALELAEDLQSDYGGNKDGA